MTSVSKFRIVQYPIFCYKFSSTFYGLDIKWAFIQIFQLIFYFATFQPEKHEIRLLKKHLII